MDDASCCCFSLHLPSFHLGGVMRGGFLLSFSTTGPHAVDGPCHYEQFQVPLQLTKRLLSPHRRAFFCSPLCGGTWCGGQSIGSSLSQKDYEHHHHHQEECSIDSTLHSTVSVSPFWCMLSAPVPGKLVLGHIS